MPLLFFTNRQPKYVSSYFLMEAAYVELLNKRKSSSLLQLPDR